MDFTDEHYVKLWLDGCESPIERQFADALLRAAVQLRIALPDGSWRDLAPRGPDLLIAEMQYDDPPYRLDFLLTMHGEHPRTASVVVELDGHEFHERTKEQARHDRSRDRALTTRGASIFRFTGSEIHRDADGCVAETLVFLRKRLEGRR